MEKVSAAKDEAVCRVRQNVLPWEDPQYSPPPLRNL